MSVTGWSFIDVPLAYLTGFAPTLTVIGGGDVLMRAAHDLPQPRVRALTHTALLTLLFTLLATTLGAFLVVSIVPAAEQALWMNTPLAGLAQHLAGPWWMRDLMALALAGAALLMLLPVAHAALRDAEHTLHRSAAAGALPSGLTSLRFGTPASGGHDCRRDDSCHACERRTSHVAGACLCDRDRDHAALDDRDARSASPDDHPKSPIQCTGKSVADRPRADRWSGWRRGQSLP